MNQIPIAIALVILILGLACLGAMTKNEAIVTMAAGVVTGLFAWLQVQSRKSKQEPKKDPPEKKD